METIGQRLKQRREARGATLEAVIRATRLTRAAVVALETDRFESLAAPIYVRGFLRIYAQFLELDPEALLESYEQQVAVRVEEAAVAVPAQLPEYFRSTPQGNRSLSAAQLFLLVATAAIVGVFMWSVNRGKRAVTIASLPAAVTAPATATGPTPQLAPPVPSAPPRAVARDSQGQRVQR